MRNFLEKIRASSPPPRSYISTLLIGPFLFTGGLRGGRLPFVGLPHRGVLLPSWPSCQCLPHHCHHPREIPGTGIPDVPVARIPVRYYKETKYQVPGAGIPCTWSREPSTRYQVLSIKDQVQGCIPRFRFKEICRTKRLY